MGACLEKSFSPKKCKFLNFRDHEKGMNFRILNENGQIESIQWHEK